MWDWSSHLYVAPSQQNNGDAGLGLFASIDLPAFSSIPIFAAGISPAECATLAEADLGTHVIKNGESILDGNPRRDSYNAVGGRSLYIASMINQPSPRRRPNCVQMGGFIVVGIKTLKKGMEYLLAYNTDGRKYPYKISTTAQKPMHFAGLETCELTNELPGWREERK
jgi:hypothetical protein